MKRYSNNTWYGLKPRVRSNIEIETYEETVSREAYEATRIAYLEELERESIELEIEEIETAHKKHKKEMAENEANFDDLILKSQFAIEEIMENEGLSYDEAVAKYNQSIDL